MIKKALVAIFLMALPSVVCAQLAPVPMQSSSAAEGSHAFSGRIMLGATVSWSAATTARYFMVFDGTSLPGDGATASCGSQGSSPLPGCLAYCVYLSESTIAPNRFAVDFTAHPIINHYGVVEALSSGADCSTLTADGANDFFFSQVRY